MRTARLIGSLIAMFLLSLLITWSEAGAPTMFQGTVVGIVERHGRAFAKAVTKGDLSTKHLTAFVRRHVDAANTVVITDEYPGYRGLKAITSHYTINHSVSYAVGETHTNTIEGFWALIKRAWYGQHHHYSRTWADHYICETTYKYNNRKNVGVFDDLMRHMVGVAV